MRDPAHATYQFAAAGVDGLWSALDALPVIGIVRGCPPTRLLAVADAAFGAGLTVLELTLDSTDALAGIAAVRKEFPERVVGAGTARTAEEATAAIDSGAEFVVSPVTDVALIEACDAAHIPALPGAATPSEIHSALELGAFAVKVFPARQLGGPSFVAAISGPLGNPRLVPTGGVDAGNAAAFLNAGAYAVAVGSGVFSRRAMEEGDLTIIASRVKETLGAVA